MIKKIIQFITVDIWHKKESEFKNPKVRWALRPFKIVIYTVQGLAEHQMNIRAAALTFFTLMSLVPIAALIFGVVKGFGLDANLHYYLYGLFPQNTEMVDYLIEFANNMLQRTKGGVVAAFGFVVLLWAVVKVFGNIEKAFNNIWEIRKSRPFTRKFSDYITVVFVSPILIISASSLASYIRKSMSAFPAQWFVDFLFGLLVLAAVCFVFGLIYYVLPNTRVRPKGAFLAGVVAGTAFLVFKTVYFYIQGELNTYNMVYGSFAALPLFLLWLQSSWMILLFGAELSYAYQNISKYELERESMHMCYDYRRKVMVSAMYVIAEHFVDSRKGAISASGVAGVLELPTRIVRDVIFDLESAGLIATLRSEEDDKLSLYIPAKDIHTLTVVDVVNIVEESSQQQVQIDIYGSEVVNRISDLLDEIKKERYKLKLNVPIIELIGKEEKDD